MNKWQKVHTKNIHHYGKYYRVEVDEIITPGGDLGEYSVVRMRPYVIIIPIDEEGFIYFVRQHRYPTDQFTIELPMGNTDGKEPIEAAKRELEEEAGLISDNWEELGKIQVAIGIGELMGHIFIAKNVRSIENPVKDPLDKDLFEIKKYSLEEIKQMILSGEIDSADTLCAFYKTLLTGELSFF